MFSLSQTSILFLSLTRLPDSSGLIITNLSHFLEMVSYDATNGNDITISERYNMKSVFAILYIFSTCTRAVVVASYYYKDVFRFSIKRETSVGTLWPSGSFFFCVCVGPTRLHAVMRSLLLFIVIFTAATMIPSSFGMKTSFHDYFPRHKPRSAAEERLIEVLADLFVSKPPVDRQTKPAGWLAGWLACWHQVARMYIHTEIFFLSTHIYIADRAQFDGSSSHSTPERPDR